MPHLSGFGNEVMSYVARATIQSFAGLVDEKIRCGEVGMHPFLLSYTLNPTKYSALSAYHQSIERVSLGRKTQQSGGATAALAGEGGRGKIHSTH